MTTADSVKALLPDFERACALAAGACLSWVGQGDKEAAGVIIHMIQPFA